MKTDFLTNFVDNCHVNAGKDEYVMRQRFPSFQNRKREGNIGHSMNIIFTFSNFIHLFLFIRSFIHLNNQYVEYSHLFLQCIHTKHFRNDYC